MERTLLLFRKIQAADAAIAAAAAKNSQKSASCKNK